MSVLWFNVILRSNFLFFCFSGMVMYDNNMIMSLKQKKRKFEPGIKLNHNICNFFARDSAAVRLILVSVIARCLQGKS